MEINFYQLIQQMNKRQQELFVSFFQEIHQTEQILDKLKIQLAKCEDFNPHLIFDMIAQGQNQITIQQLRSYLTQRIACNHRELYETFQKFDWSRQGFISRRDFIFELTPFGRPPVFSQGSRGRITTQIQSALLALFIQILNRFRIVEVSRKEVVFIQPYDAFSHIDFWKKGIIGLRDLQKFYRDNDFEIGQIQLFYLLHGLRRRCYRQVNLEVFCQNLNPLQFGQYPAFNSRIVEQNQKQFLSRSRRQEEVMRRSRVDNQKLQHEAHRAQRRKQAQIQRQLQLEERVNLQIIQHQDSQQKQIRRSLLEQQKNIRRNIKLQNEVLTGEHFRNLQEKRRIQQIQYLRNREVAINQNLARSALRKQEQLQNSRRLRQYERDLRLKEQIDKDRQARNAASRLRQLQISRRALEQDSLRQRERIYRQIQLERLRSRQPQSIISNNQLSAKQSRISDLQKQLDKTRAQMRQRRSRLQMEDRLRRQKFSESKSGAGHSYLI